MSVFSIFEENFPFSKEIFYIFFKKEEILTFLEASPPTCDFFLYPPLPIQPWYLLFMTRFYKRESILYYFCWWHWQPSNCSYIFLYNKPFKLYCNFVTVLLRTGSNPITVKKITFYLVGCNPGRDPTIGLLSNYNY